MTNHLAKRVYQHKENLLEGFTKKYHVRRLVYYEEYNDVDEAIGREKRLKKWNREWKIDLIESVNHEWRDLYDELW